MSQSYAPQPTGLAARVIEFFDTNPDEELTTADVAVKFGVAMGGVQASLARAVNTRLLRREVRDHVGVYSASLRTAMTTETE